MKNLITSVLLLSFFAVSNTTLPQSSLYKTKEVEKAYKNGTRSVDGNPGANYWTNTIDYKIEASFDPDSLIIVGNEVIQYHNNSPDTLRSVGLMLKQNLYQKGGMRDFPVRENNLTDGVTISSILIGGDTIALDNQGKFTLFGTQCRVRLDSARPVMPGSVARFEIGWRLKMPERFEIRTGRVSDSACFVGYWFPQVTVHDDISGWDNAFHTGIQETYNEISNFNVALKIPGGNFVWAAGELQEPGEIYSPEILRRIEKSKQTGETVRIVSEDDLKRGGLLADKELIEWNFIAEKVPDFAFAMSSNYVWDATSAVTDKEGNKKTWVNVVYHPSVEIYKNTIGFAKEAIEYFSEEFPGVPFPFQKHTTFLTNGGGGMEYPMMAANGRARDLGNLAELTAHEIAHSYFPFYVNTNEEKHAWMDEGFVTLLGGSFPEEKNLKSGLTSSSFSLAWNTENDIPLMVPSSYLSIFGITHYQYIKASTAFRFMFGIFEEKGLEHPMKEFITRWKHKHPIPFDYFNTMEDLLGEALDWYWKPWYFEFHAPDLKIEEVKLRGKHAEVSISNPGGMPVPVDLKVEFDDGEILEEYRSAYIWKEPGVKTLKLATSGKPIKKIELGNERIPDSRNEDNSWEPGEP